MVLLGAGASRDAGLPLAADLTDCLRQRLCDPIDEPLRRALRLVESGICFRRGTGGNQTIRRVDIEEILEIADLLADRRAQPLSAYVDTWNAELEELSRSGDGYFFRSLVSRARDMLPEALAEPNDLEEVEYLAGIAKLGRNFPRVGGGAYPVVFSLNYDRCAERAFSDAGLPFTTGFREGRWDGMEFSRANCLRLFKLHGSFGWVRLPEYGTLYDVSESLRREDINVESYEVADELVFGTSNKLQVAQPFLWMVNRFSEEIQACRWVVAVGYSFGDPHVNEIISLGMAADPQKRLIVVDPSVAESQLEAAPQMSVYPVRTIYMKSTAKEALGDDDMIVRLLKELRRTAAEEKPF